MDLRYTAEYEAFRDEVRRFLEANWPLGGDEARLTGAERDAAFRLRAIAAGYQARNVPRRYGGSEQPPDVFKSALLAEEFARAGAPGDAAGLGPSLLVPTLLDHGAEWQRQRFIPPTLSGEFVWCQGYSEPGSGSDLASLQTRAVLEGDHWVIHGQKIWTSGAQRAHYMFCLCRTEPEVQKHAGISYLLIDMKQPGIEVRPLKQITGDSHFNEVFFDGATTPADWIVGKRGEGWIVSRSTLKHERNMIGNASRSRQLFDALLQLARTSLSDGRPAIESPDVRQRLAALEASMLAHETSSYRQMTRAAHGRPPGLIQLLNKLVATNFGQEVAKLALDLLEDDGLIEPHIAGVGAVRPPPTDSASWVAQYLSSLGSAIAGGTANIQRNVIGERGLGLPRDEAAQRSAHGATLRPGRTP